jgi:hypothetical protein
MPKGSSYQQKIRINWKSDVIAYQNHPHPMVQMQETHKQIEPSYNMEFSEEPIKYLYNLTSLVDKKTQNFDN